MSGGDGVSGGDVSIGGVNSVVYEGLESFLHSHPYKGGGMVAAGLVVVVGLAARALLRYIVGYEGWEGPMAGLVVWAVWAPVMALVVAA